MLKKALSKYRSDGLLLTLQSAKSYIYSRVNRRAIESQILNGERQFDIYTNSRHYVHKVKYSAPADPWRPIYINPSEVGYYANPCRKEWGLGRIEGGDWDTPENLYPIEEKRHWIVKGLRQRFVEGKDWQDTLYVEHAKEKLDSGDHSNYRNVDEFLNIRCEFVDGLFESIKNDGYRPNFEAEHTVPKKDIRNHQSRSSHRLEPLVVIGRDGRIYCHDGFHRLTIAQILDINPIPVNVLARHKKWQKIRDGIYEGGRGLELCSDIQRYRSHPDMTDLTLRS